MQLTTDEILTFIASTQEQHDLTTNAILQSYVEVLARISPKLSQHDLADLVAVAAALFQLGLVEFRETVDQPALFAALKASRAQRTGRNL